LKVGFTDLGSYSVRLYQVNLELGNSRDSYWKTN